MRRAVGPTVVSLSNVPMKRPQVVLVEPEIPWNTGNVGRTCLGFGADLYLAGRLGFSLEDRYLKRAGLDYWPQVKAQVHPDARDLFRKIPSQSLFLFSAKAKAPVWDVRFPPEPWLVFGAETRGLPAWLWSEYPDRFFRIPTSGPIRSLNLSTAVGIVLGEVLRQTRPAARPRLVSSASQGKNGKKGRRSLLQSRSL
jgi:tRNA (cytidine/uridine-2'-O-)-methyltransferase